MRKWIYTGTGIVLIVGVIALSLFTRGSQKDKYETVLIDRGNVIEKITATGTINPLIIVRVGSQVSGRIAAIYADFNAQVKKGQVIATLETDIYQTKVEQADANFKLSQAQTQEARVTLQDAHNNLTRIKNLTEGSVASERDLEVAETAYEAAKAVLSAAKAKEVQASALLNAAKVDLKHTTIYSPVKGIVISRNCDVGQTVVASFQTPDLFLIAQDLKKMQVEAYVDEADIGNIKTGQRVLFTVDAFPDQIFRGKVSQVRFAPKEQQNVVTYATVVEVENPDLTLRPGMTATVSIITAESNDVVRIPNIALRFKADPEDNELDTQTGVNQMGREEKHLSKPRQRIWILGADGKPKSVLLEVGISDERYTEIHKGSVKGGERVIVGYGSQTEQDAESEQSRFRLRFRR
jgi:HlyD family secretion protein